MRNRPNLAKLSPTGSGKTFTDQVEVINNRGIRMKVFACIAAAATLLAMAVPASAQFAKPDDAINYRQSALTVMGTHFGRIGAMVNGKVPFDAKTAVDNAEIVAEMAKLPWAAFGAGTEKGSIPTHAKPELFAQPAKFREYSEKLVDETAKLVTAAKTGNAGTLKTAFGAAANACKACHDDFRSKS
jgi:cytochrome c556